MGATSVRLPDELMQSLDELARQGGTDRSTALRRALERGVQDLRLDFAVQAYLVGRKTAWAAAAEAGVTLWDLIDALRARGLGIVTDEDHLREQLAGLA